MNIYLDDNITQKGLVSLLIKAGHSLARPADVGLTGATDVRHLEHAIRTRLVVLTKDSKDFQDLHQLVLTCGGRHPGILLIRHDNDPKHDMKPKHIATALEKLAAAMPDLTNHIVVLNHWR